MQNAEHALSEAPPGASSTTLAAAALISSACLGPDEQPVYAQRIDVERGCFSTERELVGYTDERIFNDIIAFARNPDDHTVWKFASRTAAEVVGFELCGDLRETCNVNVPEGGLQPCPEP